MQQPLHSMDYKLDDSDKTYNLFNYCKLIQIAPYSIKSEKNGYPFYNKI